MFIYNGTFTWGSYAGDEMITIVFPAGFALNDPVGAFWQLSNTTKSSVAASGVVQSITTPVIGPSCRLTFSFGDYSISATTIVSDDIPALNDVTICNLKGEVSPLFNLDAMHADKTMPPSPFHVYTGRLMSHTPAKDEMVTLVVPYDVVEDKFFGLYFLTWIGIGGAKKANMADDISGVFEDTKNSADSNVPAKATATRTPVRVNGTFENVQSTVSGTTANFRALDYTYNFEFNDDSTRGSFDIAPNVPGDGGYRNKFVLVYNVTVGV